MTKFIKQILEKLACKHNWVEIKDIYVEDISWGTFWHVYHYKCKKCGKFKKIKSH